MQFECEVRRRSYLTVAVMKKLRRLKPIETYFIIYWNDLRAYVNCNNPRIEKKTLLKTKPIFLNWTTLEICYESQEEIMSSSMLYDIIKNGLLVKKSVYLKEDGFILYTLENIEVNIHSLQNKCVIELENPSTADDSSRNLYLQTALTYGLNIDEQHLTCSVENVSHNPFVAPTNEYPKVDGERGLVNFYSNYEIFTSNTTSFTLKPPLCKQWGKEYSFYLKNITFVAELVGNILIFIDLAHSKHFGASARLEFIERLAQTVRKAHPSKSSILFQSFDAEYIKSNIKTDGTIYIYNDRLYKTKYLSTVDLRFISSEMVDRNGICYKLYTPDDNLTTDTIYECLLDKEQRVVSIIKPRHDKFFPNTRKVVLYTLMCQYPQKSVNSAH